MKNRQSTFRQRKPSLFSKKVLLAAGFIGAFIIAFSQLMTPKVVAQPIAPSAADSFVDSVGVVMHLSYSDTAYAQNWDQTDKTQNVRELLGGLGVRHVRDGIPHPTLQPYSAYVRPRMAQLHRDYGIHFLMLPDVRTNEILNLAQLPVLVNEYATGVINLDGETFNVRNLLEAIEGPNEYDNHNTPEKRDPNWVQNLKNYQAELYRQVKNNPLLAQLPVVMPSLVYTKYCSDALGTFGNTIDIGNLHPYPNYPYFIIPTGNLDWHLGYGKNCYGNKPIYVTETGYQSGDGGISDQTIAKYTSRILAEYFLRPEIKRTYLYSLIDTLPERDRWGLIRPERNGQKKDGLDQFTLTPKPSYYAVKNLLNLLQEGRWVSSQRQWVTPAVQLKPVDLSFEGKNNSTHYLLLQKSDNDYFLLIWQEVEGFNPQRGNFNPEADEVNIILGTNYKFEALYKYDESFSLQETSLNGTGDRITVQVPDSVMVVRFRT